MKKMSLLLAGILLFVAYSHAQLSKGQKMLGGEISFSSETNEMDAFFGEQKITSFTIVPQIGFGLSNNWVIGGGLGFAHSTQKAGSGSDYEQIANIFSASLFARKFHPFGDKAGIYGELGIGGGFGTVKESQSGFDAESDINTIGVSLRPGFYYRASKRIILEANFGGLSYTNLTYKNDIGEKSKNNEFSFQLTSTFGLGFQVIL
jgi:hypothetical protein